MFKVSWRSSISYVVLLFFTTASIFEMEAFAQTAVAHGKPHINQLEDFSFNIKRYSKNDLQKAFGKTGAKRLIHNNIYALELRLKNEGRYPLAVSDIFTNLKHVPEYQLKKLLALDGFSQFLQIVGTLLCGSILFPLILVAIPLLTLLAVLPCMALIGMVCPPLTPLVGILGFAAVICSPFLVTHSILSAQLNGVFDQLPTLTHKYPMTLNPGQEISQLLFVKKEELFKSCKLMVMTQQQQCATFTSYVN